MANRLKVTISADDETANVFRGLLRESAHLQQGFNSITAKNISAEVLRESERSKAGVFQISRQLQTLQQELARPLAAGRTFQQINKEIDDAARRLRGLRDEQTKTQLALSSRRGQPPGLSGGGGGRTGEIGEGAAGALGIPLSAGAAAGAVTLAGLVGTKKLIDAGREATDTQRLLQNSAKESGLSYDSLSLKAENFGRLMALSNNDARRTFADITRLAQQAGRTQDLDRLAKGFADLSAARGIAAKDVSTITTDAPTLTFFDAGEGFEMALESQTLTVIIVTKKVAGENVYLS